MIRKKLSLIILFISAFSSVHSHANIGFPFADKKIVFDRAVKNFLENVSSRFGSVDYRDIDIIASAFAYKERMAFAINDKKIAAMQTIKKVFGFEDQVNIDDVKYTINLMWINKELKNDQMGIHPKNDTFIETVLNWAQHNKNSVINVWFDSAVTSEKAINITRERLRNINSSSARIMLRDIRMLPEVKKNATIFSDKRMPVYFRADLARAIVLDELIHENPNQYAVYSDLDIGALSEDRLFDIGTLTQLKRYGLVMASHGGNFENGFQIMSNSNTNMINVHKKNIIDDNVEKAHREIAHNRDNKADTAIFRSLPEAVFYSYRPMFNCFFSLEKNIPYNIPQKNVNYPPISGAYYA